MNGRFSTWALGLFAAILLAGGAWMGDKVVQMGEDIREMKVLVKSMDRRIVSLEDRISSLEQRFYRGPL